MGRKQGLVTQGCQQNRIIEMPIPVRLTFGFLNYFESFYVLPCFLSLERFLKSQAQELQIHFDTFLKSKFRYQVPWDWHLDL